MVPDKLINFRCYDEGDTMIGITDVTLPNLAYVTEEIAGAGIAGPIDSPTIGHFQSLTITINWRSLISENIIFAAPKTYQFAFMGSVQVYNYDTGSYISKAVKVVVKCVPKAFGAGTLNPASQMGTNGEFELIYVKISIEDKEYIEIDKLAFICRIDGVDYLSKVRQDMGMA